MCTSAPFMTFFSRSNQSGYTWQPDCNSWTCPDCRPGLEKAWAEHASNVFQTCPSGIGYSCVRADRIAATMKQLTRAGTQYLRVRGHGIFHVYTANPDLGQKKLTQQQATDLITEHLALAPSRDGHVISTSRAWRRASTAPVTTEPSDLKCIATRVGPEAVRRILDHLGQTCSFSGQTLSFRLDSQETTQSFLLAVQAERSLCPKIPSYTKKRKEISDRQPQAAIGGHWFPPNPAFAALRSP